MALVDAFGPWASRTGEGLAKVNKCGEEEPSKGVRACARILLRRLVDPPKNRGRIGN